MLLEAIAAGLLGAALLWLVAQPILFPTTSAPRPELDAIDPEETPRGQALLALKEIEFDRATGKLSEADYNDLNARYGAAAIAALEPEPAAPPPSSAPSPAPATATGLRCLTHGGRPESDARFCSECGAGLVTAASTCAGCAAAVPDDASFCPGCGRQVRSEK
ncbi:MAG: zinc ribbon domain-containing protein [Gemmatimonadales bacterium]